MASLAIPSYLEMRLCGQVAGEEGADAAVAEANLRCRDWGTWDDLNVLKLNSRCAVQRGLL